MNVFARAAALGLLVGSAIPSICYAGEWRWCAAADVTNDDPGAPLFLTTEAFEVDAAPDYQAQFEAYARSELEPIRGELTVSCSPASADEDAATGQKADWVISLEGAGRVVTRSWQPQGQATTQATAATASQSAARGTDTVATSSASKTTASRSNAGHSGDTSKQATSSTAPPDKAAEERRQSWERERVAAQNAAMGGGGALRFRLFVPVVPQMGDTTNMECYSNIIVRPGPAGWGGATYPSDAALRQANEAIEAAKPTFLAKCAAVSHHETVPTSLKEAWNVDARANADLDNWQPSRGHIGVQVD